MPAVRCGHSDLRCSSRSRRGERAPRALQAPSHSRHHGRVPEAGSGQEPISMAGRLASSHVAPGIPQFTSSRWAGTRLVAGAKSQPGPRPRGGSRTSWRSKAWAIVRTRGRSGRKSRHVVVCELPGGHRGGHRRRAAFGWVLASPGMAAQGTRTPVAATRAVGPRVRITVSWFVRTPRERRAIRTPCHLSPALADAGERGPRPRASQHILPVHPLALPWHNPCRPT